MPAIAADDPILRCHARESGHPVAPNYRWDSCCAHIDVPWLLDRPVKPGDDSNGIQAVEASTLGPVRGQWMTIVVAPMPSRLTRPYSVAALDGCSRTQPWEAG